MVRRPVVLLGLAALLLLLGAAFAVRTLPAMGGRLPIAAASPCPPSSWGDTSNCVKPPDPT